MASDNPYDALGRILAEGGEIAVGKALAAGWSQEQVNALIQHRFGNLPPSDREKLESFASDMLEAGQYASDLSPESVADLQRIPVNPLLFGDSPEGRRLRFVGEFYREDTDKWYAVHVDLADVESLADMVSLIQQQAADIASRYPAAFGLSPGDTLDITGVRITLMERRF